VTGRRVGKRGEAWVTNICKFHDKNWCFITKG